MGRREKQPKSELDSEAVLRGLRIRTRRKELGFKTLLQFEGATGISRSYLSRIETGGINNPSEDILQSISNVTGISPEEFGLRAYPERMIVERVIEALSPRLDRLERLIERLLQDRNLPIV